MADIKYSRHARLRMVHCMNKVHTCLDEHDRFRECGISAREVSETVLKGSKHRQGNRILAAHKNLEVVFKKQDNVCYVITVMLRW